jgi:antitoxin component YwqK of YwqJK toxin-antitoxin module
MKNIILIGLFLYSLTAISQDTNKVDEKGKKQGDWIKKDASNGKVLYKGIFKDNNPVGKFVFYHETGRVRAISNYFNEGKDSYVASYYENGKLLSYGKYVNEKKDSVWVFYDEYGYFISTENYSNGTKNGVSRVYYPYDSKIDPGQPKILEEITYVDGVRNGYWAKYFKNGAKLGEGDYLLDQFDGKQSYFYPTGAKKAVIYFKRGIKTGYSFSYDENGEEISKNYYLNGIELTDKTLENHLIHKKKQQMQKAEEGN